MNQGKEHLYNEPILPTISTSGLKTSPRSRRFSNEDMTSIDYEKKIKSPR